MTLPESMTRRDCLRALGVGAAALTASPLVGCSESAAPPPARGDRPNVVFILADDLGYGDLGCYGGTDIRTPRLDALAESGTRLTDFYVTAPICTPSRISFLTGRYFHRGIEDGIGMRAEEITLAEMFRPAGYRTGLVGKWHMGIPDRFAPNDQGFDDFYGFKNGAIDNYSHYFYYGGMNRPVLFRNRKLIHEEGSYFPDLMVREATAFIRTHRERPFFLFVPFNMPHYPLQPAPGTREKFAHIDNPLRREYAAHVYSMDERIGQILDCLQEQGLRENTIVVFASDHGPSREERGGGGSAGALQGFKDTLFDGGIRVPFILSWPGTISAGASRSQPALSTCLMPTLAEFAGVPVPQRKLDGRSMSGMIASATAAAPMPVLHWSFRDMWALREGPWKMVAQNESAFLGNIVDDPSESNNLGAQRPDLVQRFVDSHNQWIRQLNADRAMGNV
jgi:arylsulfatase A